MSEYGNNLSVFVHCDDIMILSPFYGQTISLINAKIWKIDFSSNKSACFTMLPSNCKLKDDFFINGFKITSLNGLEYLGFPIGNLKFMAKFIEEKW